MLVVALLTHALWSTVVVGAPEVASSTNGAPVVRAPDPARPPLADAEEALRSGVLDRCQDLALRALQSGLLDETELAQAWLLRARCYSLAGEADRALRSWGVALRIKPTLLTPFDDATLTRARASLPPPDQALAFRAHTVVDGARVAIDVIVDADDVALAHTCALFDRNGEVARAPLAEPGATDVVLPLRHRFAGLPVEGLQARLLDKHGNVLRRSDVVVDSAARAALQAAGAPVAQPAGVAVALTSTQGPDWMTWTGAGAVVVGLGGMAATGAQLTQGGADAGAAATPWLVGFFASSGVVVVGTALLAVAPIVEAAPAATPMPLPATTPATTP